MTTRREFIKIATGTLAMISFPMGLFNSKEEVVKTLDATDITWDAATGSNISICRYYFPQVIMKEHKKNEIIPYEDYGGCNKCMYKKHRPRCIEMFNS
jgi:Pyruvate/2-oxoacid:ferredoxin oxidoreductase delta subunit